MKKVRVLITGPSLQDQGGVANYYNAVFPRLSSDAIETNYLEIGSTKSVGGKFHVITDQIRFWRILKAFRPDIVHLNPSLDFRSFIRDGLFIFLGKLRQRKVLVFFRGWQAPFEARISGPLKAFFSITYARADAFIVLADKFSYRLREWGVTSPIFLGTTTVDDELLSEFSIVEKTAELENTDTIKLLYLARLERDKGVLELVGAVSELLKTGAAVVLTIAGDGPIRDELQSLIGTLGRDQCSISLIGYVRGDEKIAIFKAHHIFCFPTQYGEGMPNSVLEAMAFGLAVVTCPVGGIADFFEDKRMGVLLNGTSPAEIAGGIKSLLKDRSRLVEISTYNYLYARQRFLASIVAKFLQSRYVDVLASK